MRRYLVLTLLASVSMLGACGGEEEEPEPAGTAAPPAAAADETVRLRLREENGSGRSGTATLKGGDGGFTVTLALKRPKHDGPAHIHDVTCEEYRAIKGFDAQLATVDAGLSDVVAGKSQTQRHDALSSYRTEGFSINVHSTEGGFPVVACGDIPAG